MTDEEGYPNERMQLDDESIERTRDHNEKSHKIGKNGQCKQDHNNKNGRGKNDKKYAANDKVGTCGKGKKEWGDKEITTVCTSSSKKSKPKSCPSSTPKRIVHP